MTFIELNHDELKSLTSKFKVSISILLSYDLFSFALSQKPRCVERLGSSFSQTPALWIPIHILCLLVTFFTRSIFHVVDQFSERLSRKYRYDSLEWRSFCLGPSCFDVIVWSSEKLSVQWIRTLRKSNTILWYIPINYKVMSTCEFYL